MKLDLLILNGGRMTSIPDDRDLGISAPQILEFDIAWVHFDDVWPKLWHKNGVLNLNLGCSGQFDIA